ncbi:MAG: PLD nuclease N-terminal domain-containing protein [Propionibacteriaceae bacterium]|jgi:H+/Cl- antiporter ClcA|nr:PLD nuclease N-terminal domain-containing protein [Propionibacteriaceae bacterium]
MNEIGQYIPFLIPLAIAQVVLMVVAIVHIVRHRHYRFGSMALWIVVAVVFGFIGPVVYFVFGRDRDE